MTALSKWRGSQWATLLTIILKDYLYVFSYRGRNLSAKTSVFSLIVKKKKKEGFQKLHMASSYLFPALKGLS